MVVTTVAQNIISDRFFLFDENYDGIRAVLTFPVNVTDIRLAKITLTIEQDVMFPDPLIVTSQVEIRI